MTKDLRLDYNKNYVESVVQFTTKRSLQTRMHIINDKIDI